MSAKEMNTQRMDDVLRNALQPIQAKLLEDRVCLSGYKILLISLRNNINIEHLKVQEECFQERFRLDCAHKEFLERLGHIRREMEELDKFSEIGIGQFLAAKTWFSISTEQFKQEYERGSISQRNELQKTVLMKEVEKVKNDVARFLETVRKELDLKVQKCTFPAFAQNDRLKTLIDSLVEAIHLLNSRITLVDQKNLDLEFRDLNRNAVQVETLADKLMELINRLHAERKAKIAKEFEFDAFSEKFRYLQERRESYLASGVKLKVSRIIDDFIRDNRGSNTKLELKHIQPYLGKVNDAWENSIDGEIQYERELFERLKNGLRNELRLSTERIKELEAKLKEAEKVQKQLTESMAKQSNLAEKPAKLDDAKPTRSSPERVLSEAGTSQGTTSSRISRKIKTSEGQKTERKSQVRSRSIPPIVNECSDKDKVREVQQKNQEYLNKNEDRWKSLKAK